MSEAYKVVLRGGEADGRELNLRGSKPWIEVSTIKVGHFWGDENALAVYEKYIATNEYENDRQVFVSDASM